jgi:hypothetical protein
MFFSSLSFNNFIFIKIVKILKNSLTYNNAVKYLFVLSYGKLSDEIETKKGPGGALSWPVRLTSPSGLQKSDGRSCSPAMQTTSPAAELSGKDFTS